MTSIDEINEALRWAWDTLERSQIPALLLGKTAEKIYYEMNLNVEKIELGVKKRHLTQDTTRLLKTFVPGLEIGEKKIFLSYKGFPIEIRIITKEYQFFQNPDFKYYMADEYKIPNPMYKYWKIRTLIY